MSAAEGSQKEPIEPDQNEQASQYQRRRHAPRSDRMDDSRDDEDEDQRGGQGEGNVPAAIRRNRKVANRDLPVAFHLADHEFIRRAGQQYDHHADGCRVKQREGEGERSSQWHATSPGLP